MDKIKVHIFYTGQVRVDRVIEYKNDPDCKGVFVNHDPTVQEQILEVQI